MQVNRQAETLTVQTLSLVGETDIDQRRKHVIICDKCHEGMYESVTRTPDLSAASGQGPIAPK